MRRVRIRSIETVRVRIARDVQPQASDVLTEGWRINQFVNDVSNSGRSILFHFGEKLLHGVRRRWKPRKGQKLTVAKTYADRLSQMASIRSLIGEQTRIDQSRSDSRPDYLPEADRQSQLVETPNDLSLDQANNLDHQAVKTQSPQGLPPDPERRFAPIARVD